MVLATTISIPFGIICSLLVSDINLIAGKCEYPTRTVERDWVERLGYKVSILSVTPNLRGNQLDNLDHTQVYSKRPRLFQDLTGSVPSLANAQEKAEYLLFSNPEENTLGTKSLFSLVL